MAKFVFRGSYPCYYPTTGLFAKPGEVHDLPAAPDTFWEPAPDAPTGVSVKTGKPAGESAAPTVVHDVKDAARDALEAAEALLEANPALAQRLVDEAAHNA